MTKKVGRLVSVPPGAVAPAILHEHVTNPRAKIAALSLWRVRDQTAAYLEAMGVDATRRQLEARLEELGRKRRAPKAPGRP